MLPPVLLFKCQKRKRRSNYNRERSEKSDRSRLREVECDIIEHIAHAYAKARYEPALYGYAPDSADYPFSEYGCAKQEGYRIAYSHHRIDRYDFESYLGYRIAEAVNK